MSGKDNPVIVISKIKNPSKKVKSWCKRLEVTLWDHVQSAEFEVKITHPVKKTLKGSFDEISPELAYLELQYLDLTYEIKEVIDGQ